MESPVSVRAEGEVMSDKQTATIRTAMPAAWVSVILWLVDRSGVNLSERDWEVVLVVAPIATGVLYRLAREIEGRWPMVGRVIFGSAKTPHYD